MQETPEEEEKREKGEWKETRTKNESNEFFLKVFQNRGSVVLMQNVATEKSFSDHRPVVSPNKERK